MSLERQPYTTRKLRTIERLQAWSILLYYPLEHISFLLNHSILPAEIPLAKSSPKELGTKGRGTTLKLDSGKLTRASIGFWGVYLVLQLLHLQEDSRQIRAQERLVNKSKVM